MEAGKIEIGKIIRELRAQKQVHQEEMAQYLGVSAQAISKWERGVSHLLIAWQETPNTSASCSWVCGRSILAAWLLLDKIQPHKYFEKPLFRCCWICGTEDKDGVIQTIKARIYNTVCIVDTCTTHRKVFI